MKVFSLQIGPSGERLVTGSTAAASSSFNTGSAFEQEQAVGAGAFSSGIAVSVLPNEYQKRLMEGDSIKSEELDAFFLDVVK